MYVCDAVQCSCIYYNAVYTITVELYIIIALVIITNITIICLLFIVFFTFSVSLHEYNNYMTITSSTFTDCSANKFGGG